MKGKECVLRLLDDALDDYADASDDIERLIAVVQMNLLENLLDSKEIPFCMQLRMNHIAFELMLREFEDVQFCFE